MVIQQNRDKLLELRLRSMCEQYELQLSDPSVSAMGFDERLASLIDAQMHANDQNRMNRHMRAAKF